MISHSTQQGPFTAVQKFTRAETNSPAARRQSGQASDCLSLESGEIIVIFGTHSKSARSAAALARPTGGLAVAVAVAATVIPPTLFVLLVLLR